VKIVLLETISLALHYNPVLFLTVCSQMKKTSQLFTLWMESMKDLWSQEESLGISTLGLTSIALLSPNQIPPEMKGQGLLKLLSANVQQLIELKKMEDSKDDKGEETDSEEETQVWVVIWAKEVRERTSTVQTIPDYKVDGVRSPRLSFVRTAKEERSWA